MVQAIAFDTHRFVKNLTACGFTEEQAEVLAGEQIRLLDGNLSTKADVAAVKADVAAVQADVVAVQADIAAVKAELLKWMVGAMTAQTGLIAGLIFGLVQFF